LKNSSYAERLRIVHSAMQVRSFFVLPRASLIEFMKNAELPMNNLQLIAQHELGWTISKTFQTSSIPSTPQ
jgi:hypothetical protein